VILWRISNHQDLSGLGGERADGRWHTAARGKRVVYLSEHPALALVETLANLRGNPALFPDRFQLLKVELPNDLQIAAAVAADWAESQRTGDEWLARGESTLLRIPSVPSPESWNYLLNPLRSDAHEVKVEWARSIAYDKRLFRIKGL
jgi:RES domain-containing protein